MHEFNGLSSDGYNLLPGPLNCPWKTTITTKTNNNQVLLQDIKVRDDPVAQKGLFHGECLAEMKQVNYRILLVLKYDGEIDQASCGCPAGCGPKASCKHIAAMCYVLEDFVKSIMNAEDNESCTDRCQQ